MKQVGSVVGGLAALLCACTRASPQREPWSTSSPLPAPDPSLPDSATRTLSAGDLCVTSGTLGSSGSLLSVDSPTFRAVAARSGDSDAELRFTYLGPTAASAALGSGRVREQIGLKMRAQDPCNLVYAMWRIEPGPALAVQIKRNRGQRTSAECKNHGYRTVHPLRSAPIALVSAGSSHVLRASIRGEELSVWADGVLAWQGELGEDARDLEGPVGLRSDNARFTFAFDAHGGSPAAADRCGGTIQEEE